MFYGEKFEKEMSRKLGKTFSITRVEAHVSYDHFAHIFYIEPTSYRSLPIYVPFSYDRKRIFIILK